jgi:hypothetical protein
MIKLGPLIRKARILAGKVVSKYTATKISTFYVLYR